MVDKQLKRRLKMLLDAKHISAVDFSRNLGLSSGYVTSLKGSMSFDVLRKLANFIPDANITWLITGTPPMLSSAVSELEKAKKTIDELSEKVAMLQKIVSLYERDENGKKTTP